MGVGVKKPLWFLVLILQKLDNRLDMHLISPK
jgi:hypothetical protein